MIYFGIGILVIIGGFYYVLDKIKTQNQNRLINYIKDNSLYGDSITLDWRYVSKRMNQSAVYNSAKFMICDIINDGLIIVPNDEWNRVENEQNKFVVPFSAILHQNSLGKRNDEKKMDEYRNSMNKKANSLNTGYLKELTKLKEYHGV